MVKDKILSKLKLSLQKIGVEEELPELERPSNFAFGDYSTSIALKHAKRLGKNPYELAQSIAELIETDEIVEKVEVLKPGFVNFWTNKSALLSELNSVITLNGNYGMGDGKNKKILLEFGQPNTHKLPHIGHLFSYIYGESIARILEFSGYDVVRLNYQGDIGLHVAKCLYVYQKKSTSSSDKPESWDDIRNYVQTLQECYQEGSKLYDENETVKQEVDQLNKDIYDKKSNIYDLWKETRDTNVEFYKQLEKNYLGIEFERHYFESETFEEGRSIVNKNIGQIFVESEGAVVFKGEDFGLHTRVFINKHGNPTYEAKDIGLLSLKKQEYPDFNLSLVTTASEQNEYWRVVIKASELVFPEVAGKIKHLGFGMINLTSGKMSSRTGNIVDAITLIDLVKKEIEETFAITDDTLTAKIGFSAIKYAFLRSDIFSNITFDIEKSINKEGDSGPYILYTIARCNSITNNISDYTFSANAQLNEEEISILRKLYLLPEIIEKASTTFSPHLLASFLFDLAHTYNFFYQKHQILKEKEGTKQLRLAITQGVSQILKTGLFLLGIMKTKDEEIGRI